MILYRGYDKSMGVDSNSSFIWLSDDEEFATMYGNALATLEIDENLLNCISCYELGELADELDYEVIDLMYEPSEYIADKIRIKGYNAYSLEDADYKCLCLLDKNIIKDYL